MFDTTTKYSWFIYERDTLGGFKPISLFTGTVQQLDNKYPYKKVTANDSALDYTETNRAIAYGTEETDSFENLPDYMQKAIAELQS